MILNSTLQGWHDLLSWVGRKPSFCHDQEAAGGRLITLTTNNLACSVAHTMCDTHPLYQIMSDDNCLDAASGSSPVKLVEERSNNQ